jgi:hypothetical protein
MATTKKDDKKAKPAAKPAAAKKSTGCAKKGCSK